MALARLRDALSRLAGSALFEDGLVTPLAHHREVEVDAAYAAYETSPLDAADDWGDLASFRAAAGES